MHVTRSGEGVSVVVVDLVNACALRIFLEKSDDDDDEDSDDDNEDNGPATPPSASRIPAHILVSPRAPADGIPTR